jgi:hypothetical protein
MLTFGIRNGRPTYASTGQIKLSNVSSRLDQFLTPGSLEIHDLNINRRKIFLLLLVVNRERLSSCYCHHEKILYL